MASRGIVFLMYHELEVPGRSLCQREKGYVRYILSEAVFRAQMNWLRQNGWKGLSVGNALGYPSGNSVAITFDDGCETDLITAAPILKESGFNGTFYVAAGFLGKPGYMSPAQLKQLSSLGFEIGCHSMTHAYLNDLDEPGLKREVLDARSRLEDVTGKKVEHFSCPGGRYNGTTLRTVREAGYRSLATSHAHLNPRSADPFSLGRVAIMRDIQENNFRKICNGETLWKMRFAEFTRNASRKVLGNTSYDRIRTFLLR
jgi:peptidoglycan/xylan/chitin deacetylase (PgdA/CDA1 family)